MNAPEHEHAIAAWLQGQLDLNRAQRTGAGVIVTTANAVHGPCIVEAARRGQVTLRCGEEVRTLWLADIESVVWAPPKEPTR